MEPSLLQKNRITSIDFLKGLVMVIMALDHTRDYFHHDAYFFDPADPGKSNLFLFFTRWITHFCAPTFSFLAGLSAFLLGRRKTTGELSRFLFTRGLWLVFVELFIVTFAWYFDPAFRTINLIVIWALGMSMIVLAGLVYLPKRAILAFSLLLIFGHNLLDQVHFEGSLLWAIVHERGMFPEGSHFTIFEGYALIPWVAVMSLGYCFGELYDAAFDAGRRRKILMYTGIASFLLFLVLRSINRYGDLRPWQNYHTVVPNLIGFFNPMKYPPSLMYLLMTLGLALLVLANSESWKGAVVNFFSTFGRVPFFYYIIHICLIHLLAMLAAQWTGFGWQKMILYKFPTMEPELRGYGFSLGMVYLVWAFVILSLYPICRAFDRYKQAHKNYWWLSYL